MHQRFLYVLVLHRIIVPEYPNTIIVIILTPFVPPLYIHPLNIRNPHVKTTALVGSTEPRTTVLLSSYAFHKNNPQCSQTYTLLGEIYLNLASPCIIYIPAYLRVMYLRLSKPSPEAPSSSALSTTATASRSLSRSSPPCRASATERSARPSPWSGMSARAPFLRYASAFFPSWACRKNLAIGGQHQQEHKKQRDGIVF